jgi:TRAP transporter TAXI family solute receptor
MVSTFSAQYACAKELIPIVTPGAGGTAYIFGAGIGTIGKKYVPDTEYVVQAESGSTTMLRRLHDYYLKNQQAFSVCDGNGVWSAYSAVGLFTGKEKFTELRNMTFLHEGQVYFVVRKDSGIQSFTDVRGKRIAVGPPGSTVAASGLLLFTTYGLTDKDFKVEYLTYSEVVEGIKQNSIDGGILAGISPIPAYNELSLTHSVTIIPVRADVIKAITEKYRFYFPVTVKKGTYRGLDIDVPTIAFSSNLVTHERTSADLVYKLLKAIYEHKSELVAIHRAAEGITLERALMGSGVPLHEGAIRYYKEVGVLK